MATSSRLSTIYNHWLVRSALARSSYLFCWSSAMVFAWAKTISWAKSKKQWPGARRRRKPCFGEMILSFNCTWSRLIFRIRTRSLLVEQVSSAVNSRLDTCLLATCCNSRFVVHAASSRHSMWSSHALYPCDWRDTTINADHHKWHFLHRRVWQENREMSLSEYALSALNYYLSSVWGLSLWSGSTVMSRGVAS